MTAYFFGFGGQSLYARASGALWWPERGWLIVADLHLGKSERIARRGGALLPPYETQATLDRLAAEIQATGARCVVSLGDGFDDDAAGHALPGELSQQIHSMAEGRDWIWITGNHDPASVSGTLPGQSMVEWHDGLTLRHEAGTGPDISGHYHPCVRLGGVRRRCFLIGDQHLILPAFGAYTGGLSADDPVLVRLIPRGLAVACAAKALPLPLQRRNRA